MPAVMQQNRFEYKYIIDEPRARAVRAFAQQYLAADDYADPLRNNSYPVHSLYLDSPGRDLSRATQHGHKNRFKLRIRFYDEVAGHPVFFEIKRRVNDVILKQRAAVQRASVPTLLAGHSPTWRDLFVPGDAGMGSLHQFCRLKTALEADGRAFISYNREAYASPDGHIRVTFDRQIRGAKYRGLFQLPPHPEWTYPMIDGVVLELKFTDRFPVWMREMVREMDLWRSSMAKYVTCTTPPVSLQELLMYEL